MGIALRPILGIIVRTPADVPFLLAPRWLERNVPSTSCLKSLVRQFVVMRGTETWKWLTTWCFLDRLAVWPDALAARYSTIQRRSLDSYFELGGLTARGMLVMGHLSL